MTRFPAYFNLTTVYEKLLYLNTLLNRSIVIGNSDLYYFLSLSIFGPFVIILSIQIIWKKRQILFFYFSGGSLERLFKTVAFINSCQTDICRDKLYIFIKSYFSVYFHFHKPVRPLLHRIYHGEQRWKSLFTSISLLFL